MAFFVTLALMTIIQFNLKESGRIKCKIDSYFLSALLWNEKHLNKKIKYVKDVYSLSEKDISSIEFKYTC